MLALLAASQAHALVEGRDFVTPDDVRAMAEPVLAHRIVVRGMYGRSGQGELIVAEALKSTPVPTESPKGRERMNLFWLLISRCSRWGGAQSFVFSRFNFKSLKYTRTFSKRSVYEGETVEMVEQIVNRKLLPVPWLRVESRISPDLRFQTARAGSAKYPRTSSIIRVYST